MRPETRSIGIAAAIAPLAVIPAILCNALWVLLHAKIVNDSSETLSGALGAFLVTSLFGIPVAYALTLVIGVPAAFGALKLGRANLSIAILAGSVVGAVTAVALKGGKFEFPSFFFMVWNGIVVAGAFYVLVKRNGSSSTATVARGAG
jgi:hypothetical protein